MGTRTLLFAAALVTALSSRASAATLAEVTDFGANPSALRMFVYVPDRVAPRPAVVVAAHSCHCDGPTLYAFGCFAGRSHWNADCANGRVTRSARRWGDLVRGAYRGYHGPRPRMQLWHGTNDAVLRYRNFSEEVGQWCDVLGVGPSPSATDHPRAGWTRTRYGDASGVRLEAISLHGVPNDLPVNAEEAIRFFGLDR